MTVLVSGGAASGKSAYAEALACRLGAPRIYVATMEPFGPEAAARIEKHRLARRGKGFATLECFRGLAELTVPEDSVLLLEDLGNLCANERYGGCGEGAEAAVLLGVERLRARCRHLVLVSNEVGCGGRDYAGDTGGYLRLLAAVNRRVAALADAVCEVVGGIAVYYKGAEPDVGA